MRVLVTRPGEDAAEAKALLEAQGHSVTVEPLAAIAYGAPALDVNGVQALIVTSRNALKAIGETPLLPALRRLPVFAVGPGSGALAERMGFAKVTRGPSGGRELANVIAGTADPKAGALLHLTGDRLAFDLAAALTARNFDARREVVYRSVSAEALSAPCVAALSSGALDGVILMSPRTSKTYARLIERAGLLAKARGLIYFCLSEAVSRPLAVLSPGRIEIPQAPNFEELLALVGRTAQDFN